MSIYAIPVFDTDALLVEIGLMPEWYLPDRDAPLADDARTEFVTMWRELLAETRCGAKDLGTARLPFAEYHLARRSRRASLRSA